MITKMQVVGITVPYCTVGADHIINRYQGYNEKPYMDNLKQYPPCNIIKTGDYTFTVELALAGFSKDQIKIFVEDDKLEIVSSGSDLTADHDDEKVNYLHQGISSRAFQKYINLEDDVEVKDDVTFKNGILSINLERIVPEEKKPREIKIKSK